MSQRETELPEHIEAAIDAIAGLHAEHHRKAGRMQRMVSATTAFLARPLTLGLLTVAIAAWIVVNLALLAVGARALDGPPFPYLADAASIVALYLTAIILITQRHDDALATRRDQLTLQLAISADQKSAKIIALLEELRRSDPNRTQEHDEHAAALSEPTEPQTILDAMQAAQSTINGAGSAAGDAS